MPGLDLPVAMTISREQLALTPLNINSETEGYLLLRGGFDLGSRTWRRQTVQSPFTDGRTIVGAVMDVVTREFTFEVRGSTAYIMNDRMHHLIRAFSQFSYTLTATIQGYTRAWRCEIADVEVGDAGKLQEFHAMSFRQNVTFSVPCNPRQITNSSGLGAI